MYCQPFNITTPTLSAGEYFEVFYKLVTDTSWQSQNFTAQSFQICGLGLGQYDYKIRRVKADGNKCAFKFGSFIIALILACPIISNLMIS